MNFRLMNSGWDKILDEALAADRSQVRIICPFIKAKSAKRLLVHGQPNPLEIITRYNLDCFRDGVSDIPALRLLLKAGGRIRGVKNLHAKVYLIGSGHAVVTSANLTEQGLTRNHEFGFHALDDTIAASCHDYFAKLWADAGPDLTVPQLDTWEARVTAAWASGAGTRTTPSLGDEGADLGLTADLESTAIPTDLPDQGFVKFFGTAGNRFEHSHPIFDEVDRSGCYFACNYPANKRPRAVKDGAAMFMARLVKNPTDIVIFGRAIGMHYREGIDEASPADLAKRPWKVDWPRYIRVHNAEFIDGTFSNGIPLSELMSALGPQSFAATARNATSGQGNTEPRRAFNQQAAVELTPAGIAWLTDRMNRVLTEKGRISAARLATLDWPII